MSSFDGILFGNGDDVGNFCYPNELPILMIKIICPPLGVYWEQSKCGFPDVVRIIKNFIFTTFFYFPGLIHAISVQDACPDKKSFKNLGILDGVLTIIGLYLCYKLFRMFIRVIGYKLGMIDRPPE
tara:strand:+ start:89 stop:466 length:378 start_codon:yes stop_codon:yes gene_type:complete